MRSRPQGFRPVTMLPTSLAVIAALWLIGCSAAAVGPDGYVMAVATSSPAENCPPVESLLKTDASDRDRVKALLPRIAEAWLGNNPNPPSPTYTVGDVKLASEAGLRGEHAKAWCGEAVYQSTWIGSIIFPDTFPSNSARSTLFYITKTRDHWTVWAIY